jgi:streptomycin 6-kinase
VPGGALWLDALPRLAAECAEEWGLTLEPPFTDGHASLAIPAGETVLKLNFPERETEHEGDALAHWDGDGAVRLLARDEARGALLLERARPGTAQPDLQTAALALRRLHAKPAPPMGPFRSLAGEAERWAREIPRRWAAHGRPGDPAPIEFVKRVLPELVMTQDRLVVTHQDLHGGNLLSSARGWLAIDPKPLVGEPAFDCASLVRDHRSALRRDPHPQRTLELRIDTLSAALELDRERVRAWAIVHSLAWGLEDHRVHQDHLACAAWMLIST